MKSAVRALVAILLSGLVTAVETALAAQSGSVVAWGSFSGIEEPVPDAARDDVVSVALGPNYALALKSNGSVVAWPLPSYFDLGQVSVPPDASFDVIAISAGGTHAVAVKRDGSVVAWGDNRAGESTVPPAARSGVIAVAAGWNCTLAVKADGSVVGWGYDGRGQITVPTSAQSGVVAVALGDRHAVALKADGGVVAWGGNRDNEATVPAEARSGVTAIAAGEGFTLALKSDGTVLLWGTNEYAPNLPTNELVGVTAIAAGLNQAQALKSDGSVVVWGKSLFSVPRSARSGVIAIAAGSAHSLAVVVPVPPVILHPPVSQTVTEGKLASFSVDAVGAGLTYLWRKEGQELPGGTGATLNLGAAQPGHAGEYSVIVRNSQGSLTSSPPATLTVRPSPSMVGSVVGWGRNDTRLAAIPAAAQAGVVAIAAGDAFSLALKLDGSIVGWGTNDLGQITLPVEARVDVTAIAAGTGHGVALKREGSVLAWGDNRQKQAEVPLAARTGVVAIAAGAAHTLALRSDGRVVAWGTAIGGFPEKALEGVVGIAGGDIHSAAQGADGSVLFWGGSTYWQYSFSVEALRRVSAFAFAPEYLIGLQWDGSVVTWDRFARPLGIAPQASSGIVAIAANASEAFAVKDDGSLSAWTIDDFAAVALPSWLPPVAAVAAGKSHTLALVRSTPPVITQQPVGLGIIEGESFQLAVEVSGPLLSYQWYKDGIPADGATNASFGNSQARLDQAGAYTVIVSNFLGSVTSSPPARLAIRPAAEISDVRIFWGYTGIEPTNSANCTVKEGQIVALTAFSGGEALTYQWLRNGLPVSGATGSTLPLGMARLDLAGDYAVVVSNPTGSVTSTPPANLTVILNRGAVIDVAGHNVGEPTVPAIAQHDIVTVSVGGRHATALTASGGIVTWGSDVVDPAVIPSELQSDVIGIAEGVSHSVALKADGKVMVWAGLEPWVTDNAPPPGLGGVVGIAAGWYNTLALKNDGSVAAWGEDWTEVNNVPSTARSGIVAVAAGLVNAAALRVNGSVVTWGASHNGLLTVPTEAQSGVAEIAVGSFFIVALKTDGSVVAWGSRYDGEMRVPAAARSGVKSIAAGTAHAAALKHDGSIVLWGLGSEMTVPPGPGEVLSLSARGDRTLALVQPVSPSILYPPENRTVNLGENAYFSVTARGIPLNYQWRKDGVEIPGAVGADYMLGRTRAEYAGEYTVIVSNSLGSVTSAPPAVLNVRTSNPTSGAVVAWGRNSEGQTSVPLDATSGITAIAAGRWHTLALKTNGSVLAWGDNSHSQIMVPAAARSGVVAIAAGSFHSVALKSNGSIVSWGEVYNGTNYIAASAPGDATGSMAIAAGGSHTVAIQSDGSLVGWGWEFAYQDRNPIGHTLTDIYQPSVVPAELKSIRAVTIGAGLNHAVALTLSGNVVTWGGYQTYQWMNPYLFSYRTDASVPSEALSGVVTLAAGGSHSVALKTNGSVVEWGVVSGGVPAAAQSGVVAVAAGGDSTLALKGDGALVLWGGTLGQAPIPLVAQRNVVALALGESHAVVLVTLERPSITRQPNDMTVEAGQRASFSVETTGSTLNYQWYKDGSLIPGATEPTYRLRSTLTVDAGNYTVVVKNSIASVTSSPPAVLTVLPASPVRDGVVAWGGNANGQTNVPIEAKSGVKAIAAGADYTVALKTDGSVIEWGGSQDEVTLLLGPGSGVTAIASGTAHVLALRDDGSVLTWGTYFNGKDNLPATVPKDLTDVTAIAAGGGNSLALRRDGTLVAWGWQLSGWKIEDFAFRYVATYEPSAVPAVLSGPPITGIAVGFSHYLYLHSDGTVSASGNIILPPVFCSWECSRPATPPATNNWGITAVAAGESHSMSLYADGTVREWGPFETSVPDDASRGVVSIAAAGYNRVALKDDGSVITWGGGIEGIPEGARSGVVAIAAGENHAVGLKEVPGTLRYRRTADQFLLLWPTNLLGATLQSTPDFPPKLEWNDDTPAAKVVGAQYVVTNPIATSPRFFRLKAP